MSYARAGKCASMNEHSDDPFHSKQKLHIWDRFYEDGEKDILGHSGLVIAKDGGVSDIQDLDYSMMYVQALLLCVFLTVNVSMIIRADLSALYGANVSNKDRDETSGFLLSEHLFDSVGVSTWLTSRFDQFIPLLELLALCAVGGRLLWRAAQACYQGCKQFREPENHNWALKKWTNVSLMFWESVPEVSSFSAMRLLYYVTPSVMATQAYNHVDMAITKFKTHGTCKSRVFIFLPLLRYVAMCICCLLIGFDAFLIKFRIAQSFVVSHDFHWGSVFQAAVFLYQVLGVVNLNWFVRERLGIFIFGGEDGKVDADEKARWEVWNALLAREIYREYGGLIGTAMMLGFDDYDFQSLVLDDGGKGEKLLTRAASLQAGSGRSVLARLGTGFSMGERPGSRTHPEEEEGDGADAGDRDPEAARRGEAGPEDGPRRAAAGGLRVPAGDPQPLHEPLLGGASEPPRTGSAAMRAALARRGSLGAPAAGPGRRGSAAPPRGLCGVGCGRPVTAAGSPRRAALAARREDPEEAAAAGWPGRARGA